MQINEYDGITGLPNVDKFQEKVNDWIINRKENDKFAVAYMNIDNFRYLNETLGYNVGNIFLQYIEDRLTAEIDEEGILAKLGGDKFAILLSNMNDPKTILKRLEKLEKNIFCTWSFFIHSFYVSASIGVSLYPDNGTDITTLFQNAEIAMYAAKQQQSNIVFFTNELKDKLWWKTQLMNDIQRGIENNEFMLYYQPQYNLETKEITGVEALTRWLHPQKGFISPSQFIPVAEETKQIYLLEKWIIREALNQKKQWEDYGLTDLELSINLSGKTLSCDSALEEIEEIITSYSIDYSKIILEITETAFLHNLNFVKDRLNRLKKLGIKIALDDFGTGYSSLSHLVDMPIDILKIGGNFIQQVSNSQKEALIVKNIIALSDDLKIKVIAEGIETQMQLEVLRFFTCNYGQGFLLCMPLPVKIVNRLLIDMLEKPMQSISKSRS